MFRTNKEECSNKEMKNRPQKRGMDSLTLAFYYGVRSLNPVSKGVI